MNMQSDLAFHLQILRPGNVNESLTIPGGRVLIGSGAHCDIRVDGTGAAREHVVLELEGDNVVARALSHAPPAMLNGQPLVATKLDPNAQLAVCGTRITFNVIRKVGGTDKQGPARKFATMLAISLATVVLPIAVYAALAPNGDDVIGPAPKAVALWDAPVAACKVEATDQALHLAKSMRQSGEAKRERAPFAVQDGALAVTAFETSAACFRAAGQKEEALRDEDAGRVMRQKIEREYAARRLRLELAIEAADVRTALGEVRLLRRLTSGKKGPYVEWLAMVDRRLEVNVHDAEKKTNL
jgi:hypothetical protein